MRVVMFYHSLVSDWNHGNAHFLRGIVTDLLDRDHDVRVFEPEDGWSRSNLVREYGRAALDGFRTAYPRLASEVYSAASIELDEVLASADLVLVHEWNDPDLIGRIGRHRADAGEYVLLFHDTHHRSVSDPGTLATADLTGYDGVLAFGDAIRDVYLKRGWSGHAWTWHEAADTRVFFPRGSGLGARGAETREALNLLHSDSGSRIPRRESRGPSLEGDVVWIGNWGDEERTEEIDEFLLGPVRRLGVRATVFGVRYPPDAIGRLADADIAYGGWLPNYLVPQVFAGFKVTVHIPRRPYLEALPGIPTIRPFEALACGIPLVSARWNDAGGLFTPGEDFLVARDGDEMTAHLAALLADEPRRRRLAERGRATVVSRHTCGHRVDELLAVYNELSTCGGGAAGAAASDSISSMP
jgi:spore maturation protein CgeB